MIQAKSRPSHAQDVISDNTTHAAQAVSNGLNQLCIKVQEGYNSALQETRKLVGK
jgi:hypothetical protein